MKNTRRILTFFIVLSVMAAVAAGSVSYFETSGSSSFRYFQNSSGLPEIKTVHQKYDLYRNFENNQDRLYLVHSESRIGYLLNAEGVSGHISWSVRSGERLEVTLWHREEASTSLEINHDFGFIVSGLAGCCGERPGYRVFDIQTGQFIMSFNNFQDTEVVRNPFVLSVPSSELSPRLIGLLSYDSTRDSDLKAPSAGMVNVGTLKYASKTDFFQRLQIDMRASAGFAPSILNVQMVPDSRVPNSHKIEFRQNTAFLWNIDGQNKAHTIEGVVLKIVLNGGEGDKVILIPVKRDRLNLKNATIPNGVSLRAL